MLEWWFLCRCRPSDSEAATHQPTGTQLWHMRHWKLCGQRVFCSGAHQQLPAHDKFQVSLWKIIRLYYVFTMHGGVCHPADNFIYIYTDLISSSGFPSPELSPQFESWNEQFPNDRAGTVQKLTLPERSCFIRPLPLSISTGRKSLNQKISGSGFPLAAQSMVAVRVLSTTFSWGPMSMEGKPCGIWSSVGQREKLGVHSDWTHLVLL